MSSFTPTGTKVEGILRQAADVEEVDRRVQEYEQGIASKDIGCNAFWWIRQFDWITYLNFALLFLGKTEFGSDEDAHVVGDCVKVICLVNWCHFSRLMQLVQNSV